MRMSLAPCPLPCAVAVLLLALAPLPLWADREPAEPPQVAPRQVESPRPVARAGLQQLPLPTGVRRLAPKSDAWIDPARKAVIMDGEVCFREGPIEMFACTRGTKEYESVVSVNTQAFVIHAALLSLGAKPGAPARFTPTYTPARGTEIAIELHWVGPDGKPHKSRARDWIRNVRTKQAMTHGWVFAGSGFWTDPQTGQKHYQAEGGDFICVSNFPSAMLDLPIESTQANQGLLFEAFSKRIPPLGTRVRVILRPKVVKKKS
jgi:hypothetical protein